MITELAKISSTLTIVSELAMSPVAALEIKSLKFIVFSPYNSTLVKIFKAKLITILVGHMVYKLVFGGITLVFNTVF